MSEHGAYLAFDVYPSDDPRNGDALCRLTKEDLLEETFYRHAVPTGSGAIHIHEDSPYAQYVVPGNYVRVVDLRLEELNPGTESKAVIGGFWLDDGEATVLTKRAQEGEQRVIRGPGTSYYLHRAVFPYVLKSTVDAQLELHQSEIYETGTLTFNGPETYGGIAGRIIYEARLEIPSGVADMPAHTWDDVDDSGGTAWAVFDGDYGIDYGANAYEEMVKLSQKGIDWWLDPHTFTPYAYAVGTYGTDRSSATFAAGKVRFEKAVNIAADLDRAIYRLPYISHMLVIGDEPAAPHVSIDPAWSSGDEVRWGTLHVDATHDLDVLADAGDEAIRLRKLQEDQARFPIRYGTDVGTGHYIPGPPGSGGHFWWGDLVTLHSGTGANDYDEQTIAVAAIEWRMRSTGDFQVWVELGAQYVDAATAAEVRRSNTITEGGCCPVPFCTTVVSGTGWLFAGQCNGDGADYLVHQGSVADAGDVPCRATDGSDTTWTQLAAPVGASHTWIAADFLAPVNPSSWRLLQYAGLHGTGADERATGVVIESSDDWGGPSSPLTGTWTVRDTAVVAGDDTGVVSFSGGTHRYWRIRATAGGVGGWVVVSWDMYGGTDVIGTDEFTGSSREAARCDHQHHADEVIFTDGDTVQEWHDELDVITGAEMDAAIAAALAAYVPPAATTHWEPLFSSDGTATLDSNYDPIVHEVLNP